MPSNSGSQESRPELIRRIREANQGILDRLAEGPRTGLTREEADRIADGEPYCFRCGKPASSFPEYDMYVSEGSMAVNTRAEAVRAEEGTYNPETNRFACDECYIAIGTPVGGPDNDYGWKAP